MNKEQLLIIQLFLLATSAFLVPLAMVYKLGPSYNWVASCTGIGILITGLLLISTDFRNWLIYKYIK